MCSVHAEQHGRSSPATCHPWYWIPRAGLVAGNGRHQARVPVQTGYRRWPNRGVWVLASGRDRPRFVHRPSTSGFATCILPISEWQPLRSSPIREDDVSAAWLLATVPDSEHAAVTSPDRSGKRRHWKDTWDSAQRCFPRDISAPLPRQSASTRHLTRAKFSNKHGKVDTRLSLLFPLCFGCGLTVP